MLDLRPREAIPPIPSDPVEAARWEHTRLRRRLLYGLALEDFRRRQYELFPRRAQAHGRPDLAANPFASLCSSVAALYDREPRLGHPDSSSELAMRAIVSRAGLWPMMQTVQRDALGMREMLLRVDVRVDPVTGVPEATYVPVPPDLVIAVPDPERPDRPAEVRHAVQRRDATGRLRWTWDVWSILDQSAPYHRVLAIEGEAGADVSHVYGLPEGGLVGEDYPARRSDGRPILPFVLLHAASTGHLWDPYRGIEVVDGTLTVGVYWTFFGHVLRNASHPTRWTMGAEVAGAVVVGPDGEERREAVSDPAVVQPIEPFPDLPPGVSPQIGQWAAGADPLAMAEAIGLYERRLVAYAGLDPSDVQRVSGDPRAAYALAITREAKRESQRRYSPIFRPADEEILSVTAVLVNRALGGAALPEDSWTVVHESLPPSAEEREAERADVLGLLSAGLISQTEARMRLFGETRGEAEAALAAIGGGDVAAASPFASVGLPALVASGIIGASAARRLLGVGEDAAPTAAELAALREPAAAK
jgi:hypothetical protein